MNIVWNITNVESRSSDGFITSAYWQVVARDGEYKATVVGVCRWEDGEPELPFQNVKEQDVLDWCWAMDVNKEEKEKEVMDIIESKKTSAIVPGTPW